MLPSSKQMLIVSPNLTSAAMKSATGGPLVPSVTLVHVFVVKRPSPASQLKVNVRIQLVILILFSRHLAACQSCCKIKAFMGTSQTRRSGDTEGQSATTRVPARFGFPAASTS